MPKLKEFPLNTQLGSLVLGEVISSHGATSLVYQGTLKKRPGSNDPDDRPVAVKVSRADDEDYRSAFEQTLEQEKNILLELLHPQIVRILPIVNTSDQGRTTVKFIHRAVNFEINGRRKSLNPEEAPKYILLEWLPGGTLSEQLYKKFNFSMAWRFELAFRLAQAVDYLAVRRVVHLDLKPNNIMFRRPPNDKEAPDPVIIDFGVSTGRMPIHVQGRTPPYDAPELEDPHWSSRPDEERCQADIWSLGVIFFELFTSDLITRSQKTNIRRNQDLDLSPLKKFPAGQDLVGRMLAKDPTQRIPSHHIAEYMMHHLPIHPPYIKP